MTTPRPVALGANATLPEVVRRLGEFARDTVIAFSSRPTISMKSFTFIGGDTNQLVATGFTRKPSGVWLADVKVKASPQTAITAALSLDWEWVGPHIRVRGIAGLTASTEYDVTIAMVEG